MRFHDRSVIKGAHLVGGHDGYHGVSVTCGMASTGCRRGRGSRPLVPSFLEQLGRVRP